ncbi:hypothetical protein [Herbaspirillum sp. ST 5-3]|uniref:hypothetical protein n=1 Tax=Oxalobacteraceae TaxID=75682 RepID=UPI0010A2D24C|nr:hypothetical protein [Herbaspirillum sp. ST 5-3]
MKYAYLSLLTLLLLAGCASTSGGANGTAQGGVQDEPTYPGAGVHIGVGIGSWGGHSGGGAGIGLGW